MAQTQKTPPVSPFALPVLIRRQSKALGCAEHLLREQLWIWVSLPAGQEAALGTWAGLAVLSRYPGTDCSAGPRLSAGLNASRTRGTRAPAHLAQLQLVQDIRRHSIPDLHNLCKGRERCVRPASSQLLGKLPTQRMTGQAYANTPEKHHRGYGAGLCPDFSPCSEPRPPLPTCESLSK